MQPAEVFRPERADKQDRIARQATYQVVEHLQGLRNLEATFQVVKTRTRQFAKRQLTWYQKQLPFASVNLEPGENPEQMATAISDRLRPQI